MDVSKIYQDLVAEQLKFIYFFITSKMHLFNASVNALVKAKFHCLSFFVLCRTLMIIESRSVTSALLQRCDEFW